MRRAGLAVYIAAMVAACAVDQLDMRFGPEADGEPTGGDSPGAPGGDLGGDGLMAGDEPAGDRDGGDSMASACPRTPAPADRVRHVLVSQPYASSDSTWAVWTLDTDGTLTSAGVSLQLRRAAAPSSVVFTRDGEIAITVHDDGTLGVVRLTAGGPVVVHAAFSGSFFAGQVVLDAAGDGLWVLDPNWPNNGGGVYRVGIGCDGSLTDLGLVVASQSARSLSPIPGAGDRALLAATAVADSAAGDSAHLVALGDDLTLLAGDDAFGSEAIVSSSAVSPDASLAFVGDNCGFCADPNRVAVLSVGATSVAALQRLSPLEDPAAIVVSPWGNAALVTSGFGDAILRLTIDPGSPTAPVSNAGEIAYSGAGAQLPTAAVLVERGSLAGLVLIAEVTGIRRVRFEPNGTLTDLGVTSLGGGTAGIPGTLGVAP